MVGGGSAGCALAYRLSHLTGDRILLLEAGGRDGGWRTRVPIGALWMVNNPAFDWRYDMEPDPTRGGFVQRCHSGRVLGGGSSINGMIHARGAPADFDAWQAAGAEGWSHADVLPFFRRSENRPGGDPALRGRAGPLRVEDPRSIHPTTQRFLAAARETGLESATDYNGADSEGVGLAQVTQCRGVRQSTVRAYRPLGRPGLMVRTGALATRLRLEHGRCTGVSYRWRGEPREARAETVVLSAGAIGSPKLLMLSGIGDAASLTEHGIATALHLPGVGGNLAEHIGAGIGVHVSVPTYNTRSGPWTERRRPCDGWRRVAARPRRRCARPSRSAVRNPEAYARTCSSCSVRSPSAIGSGRMPVPAWPSTSMWADRNSGDG